MGLLDKIKDSIGKTTKSSKSVVYNPDRPEIFWEAVKEQLSGHHDVKMGIPKGRAYSVVHSLAHKGFLGYCFTYSIRDGQAAVFYETYQGDEARDMIMAAVANAPEGHPVKQAILSQGKKNKDKWAWTITRQADASDNGLLQWYVDTFLPMYEFLENLPEFKKIEKASKSPSNQNQHIRVEIQIAEHDYAAFDADESMVGDTYAFNGEDGVENFELYVDGELYDFEDDDPMDVVDSKYSDYKKFDLEAKWDNEDVCSVGYYENMALLTWEFDVDKFDVDKLSINYDCYDVCFEPADYETESHILSLSYDGKTIEPSSVGCSDGDLEQIWSKYDDEDDEEIEDESDDEPVNDVCIEITPDTVIDDIYVAFTLKYPHLHLRFLSEPGVMEELVDSSKTVAETRKMLKTKPAVKSGEVQIGGGCIISDVCREFGKFGIGNTWVCCHYGKDLDPEPHGEDRTLAFAESESAEDAPYMIAGMRKITNDGKIIDETPMPLSEKFGILAATMVGMDGNISDDEIEILQAMAEAKFDLETVRKAFVKERSGVQEYESQSSIVRSIKENERQVIFSSLVMLAIADGKLSQSELQLLAGIAEIWGWDWDDDCCPIINKIIAVRTNFTGDEVEIEE